MPAEIDGILFGIYKCLLGSELRLIWLGVVQCWHACCTLVRRQLHSSLQQDASQRVTAFRCEVNLTHPEKEAPRHRPIVAKVGAQNKGAEDDCHACRRSIEENRTKIHFLL